MMVLRRRLFGMVMIITGIFVVFQRDLFVLYFSNYNQIPWFNDVLGFAKIAGGIFILLDPESYLFPLFVAPFAASILIGIADEFLAQTFFGFTDIVVRGFVVVLIVLEYFQNKKPVE